MGAGFTVTSDILPTISGWLLVIFFLPVSVFECGIVAV